MKKQFLIISILFISFLTGCIFHSNKSIDKKQGILNVKFEKTKAVGPDGLICIVRIKDKALKKRMIENPGQFKLIYSGGVYSIDSLNFPTPFIDIYDHSDSTLVFGQAVFGLRGYSDSFIDSIMQITRKEISINVADTLTKEKWIITKCKEN
jgi:hypothetical protein